VRRNKKTTAKIAHGFHGAFFPTLLPYYIFLKILCPTVLQNQHSLFIFPAQVGNNLWHQQSPNTYENNITGRK
jgi:hypothetical protein